MPVNCIRLRVKKEYTTATVRLEQCTDLKLLREALQGREMLTQLLKLLLEERN